MGSMKESNNLRMENQKLKLDKDDLLKKLNDLKSQIQDKEAEIEHLKNQLLGVEVLRKTNDRLYSELAELQAQLKRIESLNGSSFSGMDLNAFQSAGLKNLLNKEE